MNLEEVKLNLESLVRENQDSIILLDNMFLRNRLTFPEEREERPDYTTSVYQMIAYYKNPKDWDKRLIQQTLNSLEFMLRIFQQYDAVMTTPRVYAESLRVSESLQDKESRFQYFQNRIDNRNRMHKFHSVIPPRVGRNLKKVYQLRDLMGQLDEEVKDHVFTVPSFIYDYLDSTVKHAFASWSSPEDEVQPGDESPADRSLVAAALYAVLFQRTPALILSNDHALGPLMERSVYALRVHDRIRNGSKDILANNGLRVYGLSSSNAMQVISASGRPMHGPIPEYQPFTVLGYAIGQLADRVPA